MTTDDPATDPRPRFAAALDQIERQIDAVRPDDLGRPTPCAEYDVAGLVAHVVAVLRKLTVVRGGGDMTGVPDPATDLTRDDAALRRAFGRSRADLDVAWAPDPALDVDHTLAWGAMTGREVLDAYTHELTVHAWDLSRALGRGDALDPVLAEVAFAWFARNVPAEGRGEGGPFAAPVAVGDDADPYTRLAAFVGRPAAVPRAR